MSPYLIFVIVLTIAYIIYYGYNISKDVYGKKNVEEKNEEVFDAGLEEDKPAIQVKETGDGFSIDKESTNSSIVLLDENEDGKSNSVIGDKLVQISSQMVEADVSSDGGIDQIDMAEMMVECYKGRRSRFGSLKIVRENV